MAGMLASAVLKLAAAKLADAVGDQVVMQWKLKDNLEDMKDTLESMAAVLKDAERRSFRAEPVLLWLKQLKNAAYDISDMLDDFQDGQRTSLLLSAENEEDVVLIHYGLREIIKFFNTLIVMRQFYNIRFIVWSIFGCTGRRPNIRTGNGTSSCYMDRDRSEIITCLSCIASKRCRVDKAVLSSTKLNH